MRHPDMPFVVSQANPVNVYPFAAVFAGLFFYVVRMFPEPSGVCWGLAFAFIPLTTGFAFGPFNPYRETGARRKLHELRALMAFYEPANRRRAVVALAVFLLVLLFLWPLARRFPLSTLAPIPVPQVAALTFLFSVIGGVWVGLFGLTLSIRKNWFVIAERGVPWPDALKYPGPVGSCVESFISGRLPPFLEAPPQLGPGAEGAS